MPTAKNAKLQIEGGRSLHDFAAMTDSGDQKVFNVTGGTIYSGKNGFTPEVRPDGIVSGRNLLSPHADDDKVAVAAFTCYLAGVLKEIEATSISITRPATAVSKVISIVVDDTGTVDKEAGTDGATADFSEERGVAGGPPVIPAGYIEIGQIRVTSDESDAIAASEIFQNDGEHVERADYPVFSIKNLGDGNQARVSAKKNAYVEFASALPAIHTDTKPKGVYIRYYSPVFQDLERVLDFVPVEVSHGVSSKEYYRGAVASVTESVAQGSFTALLKDAVRDFLVAEKNETLTLKFFPDENKSTYVLTQGRIGIKRSFPHGDQIQAAVTVSAEEASVEF